MAAVLTLDNLAIRYGDHVAVDGLSLEARSGEILGLLGPYDWLRRCGQDNLRDGGGPPLPQRTIERVRTREEAMATVLEQLEAMRGVPENWDGYGADAPRDDVIGAAIDFWRKLQTRPLLREPFVTPTRIGGVLFGWESGPHQLEVEFESPSKAVFIYLNRETDESATGSVVLHREKPPASLALDAFLAAMPAAAS